MINMDLTGKTALVTGCDSEEPRKIAERFALAGAGVTMQYEQEETAVDEMVRRILKAGGKAVKYSTRLGNYDEALKLTEQCAQQNGGIDILVNNAKLHSNSSIMELTLEKWNKSLEGNLYGIFHISKCVSRLMSEKKCGTIINITSATPFSGIGGGTDFSASEAAVHGMTLAMARDLSPRGVRVNVIAPNGKLFKHRSDIENLAIFLASPLAGGISGEIIRLNGVLCPEGDA